MTKRFLDTPYLDMVEYVLEHGVAKTDRTGTGTISVFSYQMRFDLSDGSIPLLTTKKMFTRGVIHELLWYLQGNTNIKYLNDNNVTIWDEWADENGDLGPVYGQQWRAWPTENGTIDQIQKVIDTLRTNPDDRRLLVVSWNVGLLDQMKLPPCHYAFQFYARPLSQSERIELCGMINTEGQSSEQIEARLEGLRAPRHQLSCMLNQRSCDVGLGVPFNIVQYSILTRMIAHVVGMAPGEFIWNGGDVHIYNNHIDALVEQVNREPFQSPKLIFNREINNINNFMYDDFYISGYECHPSIKMEVSV
jgi:thymidylate synthase